MPRPRDGGGCSCGLTAEDVRRTAICYTSGCPFPAIVDRCLPRVRERDLRHDGDSVRFGHAMLKCEGYPPACSDAGRCLSDGQCFGSAPHLVAARLVEALIPTDGHATGLHLAYLRRVAELLREGHVHL